MKKTSFKAFAQLCFKIALLPVLFVCINSTVTAQLATYPLRTAHATNNNTPPGEAQVSLTSPLVNAQTLVGGTSMDLNNYNASGYRLRTNVSGSTVAWPTVPTDGFGFDIPISPVAGNDMHITSIQVRDTSQSFSNSTTNFYIVPYYRVDGAGPWVRINGAATITVTSSTSASGYNFGPINETFYSGHSYVVRFYVYADAGANKSDNVRIRYLIFNGTISSPPASAPAVSTTSATAAGLYSANIVGGYQAGAAYHNVYQAGLVWGTSANPTFPANSNDTSVIAGSTSATLTGLSAGTTYYVRSYIITQFGIFYGNELSFTTLPPTPPVVTTNPILNVLSNKATGGGVIVDSGGLAITAKGMVWNIGGGATLVSNTGKLLLNGGSASFSDFIKGLSPATTYCYRAFATNSLGTSYGSDVCFTTAAAVPVLVAIPGTIDFGQNFFGANPITVSYILTGAFLNPVNGSIAINVPAGAGFEISLSSGSGFGTSLTIPYTGSTLLRTPIFVKFLTNVFGVKNAVITHSGGGVAAADADIVTLKGEIVQSPDDVSNTGTDFYLGFGYEEKMSRKAGDADECRLSVYVTNPGSQPVKVHCDLTSGGYAQSTIIPGFGSYTFSGFPMGDATNATNPGNLPDTRLFSTGTSNKSIHVYTEQNIPVAVHMHSYTHGNSAAGSIVFPTNTWNSSYTVQAFGGESNNSNPNSFFFVIANEDNTVVTFKPTQPILDATAASLFNENLTTPANTLYPANGTYTVTLNKGQVFNAMGGFSPAGNGLDLSGTKVSTTCDKKITVFGGNGRCVIQGTSCTSTTGSDHLIQQMFPSVAWGTKYLTAPTANTAPNYYRIYFQDPASVVKVNGTALTAANLISVNGTPVYYQYQSAAPLSITSDKPINVSQFMLTPDCTTSAIDAGPEMIILSPVEQAISSVVFFSPTSGKAIIDGSGSYTSYMNVIIPASKASTFKLDGVTPPAGSFAAHPQDAGYSYASLLVTSLTKHSLTADTGFVAIAYGYGDGESYGFNAGTAVKNLSSYKISVNPNGTDSSSTVIRTCVNTPITLKIAFPYPPSQVNKIVWRPNDVRISPNVDTPNVVSGGMVVTDDTIVISGRTFYVYKSPTQFTFSANALYSFKVTAYGTFASDCPGEDQQTMLINVGQDLLNLSANPTCNNPLVVITADTIPMVGTNILSWEWDFGHGPKVSTGTLSPQNHTFPPPPPTMYMVKLTTKNTVGCISTDSINVDFGGGLEAAFTISKDTVCTNQPVTFTDGSFGSGTSGSPNSWEWNFDPVLFNGQTPPAQTWSTPGIKTIELTVRTPIGCVKTFKDTVVVEAIPVAAINANPTFVCLGDSAAYSDASTIAVGSIVGWSWSFDDGTTSTLQNPKHKWATSGSHNATLTVTSAGGCTSTNTATHTINVNPLPVAGFKYDLNCTTRTLTVTDTSNAMGGTITGWQWDFGVVPAVTSSLQNPSFVYPAAGTYTVTLIVTTANGCKSTLVSKTITIAASPVADFTLPGNTCLPNASSVFTNTSTISDGTPLTYTWNFGDASGDLNSPPLPASPTHVFPGTGPYTVSLTAISNKGCTNTKTKSYSAIFAQPVAAIAPQAAICVNSNVNFSSAASTAPGSTITGWNWNFNNEGSSTSQNPVFAFTTAGTKTVILTVTSAAGCTSEPDTILVTVNALPVAGFTDTVNCSTFSVGFTDTSVPNAGTVNNWSWTFGDVTNNTSTLQNPTHVYPASGTYTVTLTVKTDKGCTSSTAFTNTVSIAARPVPDFILPGNTCLPNANALFTNTTSISDGTLGSVTYTWDFGDTSGVVASPPNPVSPSHTYNYAANHTVTLTATSINGCIKSISKLYDKVFVRPVAVITAPAGVCLGNAANFSSTSSTAPASSVTGWQWNFGDTPAPGASTQQNPTYTYTGSGPRNVTLTVTSAAGCTSAATVQAINVNLSPVAAFTYSAIRCKDSVVTFTDASVSNAAGGITDWNWDFGGAGTLHQTVAGPVTHTFNNAQTYTVSLTLKNANGCVSASAYSTPVVINPNPVSKFIVSDICIPAGLATFTQQATISSGQVTGWSWDFGVAGAVSSAQNPTYNYATGGVYQVILKATSDSSCSATFKLPVTAYNSPTPLFDVTNAANLCSNLPVSIVNKSVVNGFGTVDKIEVFWDYLSNPTVKTTVNTPSLNDTYTNQYPVFGNQPSKTYRVLIRAYSGSGCSTDYFTDINLLAAPKVQFNQPAPVCQEAASFALTGGSDIFGLPGSGVYSGTGVVTNPLFSPAAAGFGTHTIRYTYTTTNGCSDFLEKPIVVNPTPVISFGRSTINILEGDVLKLTPSITYGATYLWTPSTFLNSATSATPSGLPTSDITYNLLVTSDKGCVDDESVFVKVVRKYVIPNTFTPNNDNNHDRWEIENLALYPDVRVRVFSRSGQLVFESYGYNTPWDGKYKGRDCPFGTYYYVIETGGGRSPRTGYVTIIR